MSRECGVIVRSASRIARLGSGAALVLAVLVASCRADPGARARDTVDGPTNADLQRELVRLGLLDQTARLGFTAQTATDTALMRSILGIDSILTSRLRAVVREHGWPTRSMVGEDGARAAFLIVQHSPSVAFQREALPLLLAAASAGEAARSDAAMLEDRVRTEEGKPQRYGTQFRIVGRELVPYPIEDAANLDRRRADVGLMPMAAYIELLEQTYGGPVRYPASSDRRAIGR